MATGKVIDLDDRVRLAGLIHLADLIGDRQVLLACRLDPYPGHPDDPVAPPWRRVARWSLVTCLWCVSGRLKEACDE